MRLDMKKPCRDCPFIKNSSTNQTLTPERLMDIKQDLLYQDASFTCHKTLDLPYHDHQHCAGALMYLEEKNRPNQWMRIAERLGYYNKNKLHQDYSEIDLRDPEEHILGRNDKEM